MARLRYNGLSTTLGGSLTNVATSVTFAAALTHSNGTNVPTIAAGDFIPLAILGATGHLSEIVWLTAYTAAGTTGTITRGQEGTTGAAHSSGDAVTQAQFVSDTTDVASMRDAYMMPTGAAAETLPQWTVTASAAPASGTLTLSAIVLPAGLTIGHIAYGAGNNTAVFTNRWHGLFDSSRVALAFTANQTSTAWSAFSVASLAVASVAAGAASSFTTTYTGLYYVGIMGSFSSGAMAVYATNVNSNGIMSGITPAPTLGGASSTGRTTVPAFPFTAAAIGAASPTVYYAYVGA